MKAYWGEKLSICRSAPYFLEVTANGIDKAGTLARVLEQLQLNKQNLVACGDGFNDISMIEYAGLGVAMANAAEEVRARANYVAPHCDEDGLVDVIHRFIND